MRMKIFLSRAEITVVHVVVATHSLQTEIIFVGPKRLIARDPPDCGFRKDRFAKRAGEVVFVFVNLAYRSAYIPCESPASSSSPPPLPLLVFS